MSVAMTFIIKVKCKIPHFVSRFIKIDIVKQLVLGLYKGASGKFFQGNYGSNGGENQFGNVQTNHQ